jgi:hypothetical protein
MTIEFSTSSYRFTHGREPRGYGAWAFEFEGRQPVWAPASTYADAMKWVKAHIRSVAPVDYAGNVVVTVCT